MHWGFSLRGCLTLIFGFVVGVGLMLYWWPKQPQGVALPDSADLNATVSDAYLTRVVAAKATTLRFPSVSHIQILSNPPSTVVVRAEVSATLVTAPLTMVLQPLPDAGRVHIHIISTSVAGVPIPSQLTGIIEDQINRSANRLSGSGAHVTGVTVTPSGLEITATLP